jgi:acyl-CoA dehydrogenase
VAQRGSHVDGGYWQNRDMTQPFDDARAALAAWRADFSGDPYDADQALRGLVDHSVHDPARRHALSERASVFGRSVVREIAAAAAQFERRDRGPVLRAWDGTGRRAEAVEFDGAYHEAGTAVWASGLVADSGTLGRAFEQATLLYLLSLEGEAGHACPAVCTIGMARALRRRAEASVRDRFLPPLLDTNYARADRASQFMTEVQGGSDVGANATTAAPAGDGTYRVSGEKWFCSVADADAFLLTARVPGAPAGTRGLGCFAIPRMVADAPNGFALRRLKDKLGTRGMASGEIDFHDAVAYPIGPVEDGFKTAVGVVLNTSRWLTAIGATGIMRRAVLEARGYARHRRAFGRPIEQFPLVQQTLASMTCEWLAALHLSWMLTELEDEIDAERADDDVVRFHRFLVNVAKYATSSAATRVVRDGIEVLGGNGTIEDFSVLPRLYRDAIVYESWEGTHNVIAQQVLNDCARLDLLGVVDARLVTLCTGDRVADAAKLALADAHRALDDPVWGALHFRAVLDRIARVLAVASLFAGGEDAAGAFLLAPLEPGYRAADDAALPDRIAAVLS